MDTATDISAAEAARRLGTSVPRVKRAIERLHLPVEERPGGRVRLAPRQLERLRQELGTNTTAPGLSRTETRVLSALARAPLGVVSVRALASRAGVTPTAAGSALKRLERQGLAFREQVWVAAGRARQAEVIRPNVASPRWPELAPLLAHVTPPARRARRQRGRRVPPRLKHLFWNTAPSQLDVDRAGPYIARRLLQSGDLEGLAWGADNLLAEHWRHAARTRGIDREDRALARNLAEVSGR